MCIGRPVFTVWTHIGAVCSIHIAKQTSQANTLARAGCTRSHTIDTGPIFHEGAVGTGRHTTVIGGQVVVADPICVCTREAHRTIGASQARQRTAYTVRKVIDDAIEVPIGARQYARQAIGDIQSIQC